MSKITVSQKALEKNVGGYDAKITEVKDKEAELVKSDKAQ